MKIKKVTSMTKKQEAKIPFYINKWLEIGRKTNTTDKNKTIAAVKTIYRIAHLREPQNFLFFDSPLQCQLAVHIIKNIEKSTKGDNLGNNLGDNLWDNLGGNLANNLGNNLGDDLWNNLKNNLGNNLWDNLGGNLANNLGNNLGDNLKNNLRNNLWSNLGNSLWNNLGNNLRNNLRNNLGNNLGDNLGDNLKNNLGDDLWNNLRNNLWYNLWNNLGGNLANNLRNNLRNNLGDNLANNLEDNLRNNLANNLGDNLWNNLANNLWNNLGSNLGDNLGNNLWNNLWDNLANNLRNNLKNNLRNNLANNLGDIRHEASFYTNYYSDWVGYYDFILNELFTEHANNFKDLSDMIEALKDVHYFIPFQDTVFISYNPVSLLLDNRGRLHGEDAPAMMYSDGYSLFYMNGVQVPKWAIEKSRAEIDPKDVLKLVNTEQRMVLMKYVGLSNFMKELKSEEIDSYKEYKLYYITIENERIGPYLYMKCPSTGREFLEGVGDANSNNLIDASIKTCEDALKWRARRASKNLMTKFNLKWDYSA